MRKSRRIRVAVNRQFYRLRNLVKRCFNKFKNARRVASCYDKTAENFWASSAYRLSVYGLASCQHNLGGRAIADQPWESKL